MACTGNATELLDAVRRLSPDAVLTDIRMPPGHHMEGIQAARAIREAHPDTGVVVLSQHADESYALALFADGSAGLGYLLKDRIGDLEDLVHALREVRAGGSVIDPQIVDTLVRRRTAAGDGPAHGTVTARARGAARDGPGQDERRHRAVPLSLCVDGREARHVDLRETPASRDGGAPARGGGTRAPPIRQRAVTTIIERAAAAGCFPLVSPRCARARSCASPGGTRAGWLAMRRSAPCRLDDASCP